MSIIIVHDIDSWKVNMKNWKKDRKMLFEVTILTILMVAQIVLFILFFNYGKVSLLKRMFPHVATGIYGRKP